MNQITVPYNFTPRPYQLELFQALDGVEGRPETKKNRAIYILHRRGGKDLTCACYMFKEMMRKVGMYFYVFPYYSQGRKVFWEQRDKDGIRILERLGNLDKRIIDTINNQEMMLRLKNGSTLRVIGADQIDNLRGASCQGVVFSEFAFTNMDVWTHLFSPILGESGGWAIFNSTPNGRNHLYTLYKQAQSWDNWYVAKLSVEDTGQINNPSVREEIEQLRALGQENTINQEYYCRFTALPSGSYFGEAINQAYEEGRIGDYPYDNNNWVDTFWDLGFDHNTAVWFRQIKQDRIVLIDYFDDRNKDLTYYVEMLRNKGYRYRTHYLPWETSSKTIHSPTSTQELFMNLCSRAGIADDVKVVPRVQQIQNGILCTLARFGKYHFNESTCEDGIEKLMQYKRRYDRKKGIFMKEPVADESSDTADALRQEAQSSDPLSDPYTLEKEYGRPVRIIDTFHPFERL